MTNGSENAGEAPTNSGPVLFYNETVLDHFTNPRNVGQLKRQHTDGYALVGDPSCGDQMKLWISVKSDRIFDNATIVLFRLPGWKEGKKVIYLDHNATTPLHPRVFDSMEPYLRECWSNPSSPYRPGREAKAAVEDARGRIANCIGCKSNEIVFTAGGTEADNLAIRGVARALKGSGNHVVTSSVEHHAVLHTCGALEDEGCRVTYLPVTTDGQVDPDEVARNLSRETVLISVMLANNETGVINPVKEIAEVAKQQGVPFHADAVQGLGKIPVQVEDLGVDLASFAGHKIYGPKGAGFLYVKEGTPITPVITGGSHEHGLRAGTENVAGIVGLAEAVVLAISTLSAEAERLESLRRRLEKGVSEGIFGVKFNGSSAPRVPNTANLSFQSVDGESIVLALDLEGICVSTGSACSTGDPEPSHVLTAMGLSARDAQGSIRVSLGKDTTEENIDFTVRTLVGAIEKLRAISSVDSAWTLGGASIVKTPYVREK